MNVTHTKKHEQAEVISKRRHQVEIFNSKWYLNDDVDVVIQVDDDNNNNDDDESTLNLKRLKFYT